MIKINKPQKPDLNEYVAENNNLVGIRNVKPIYYDEGSVIISGLKDGEKIISSYIPGIYKGMKIKISD